MGNFFLVSVSDSVKNVVCVSFSAPADGDDGEMQEAGEQVSVKKLCNNEVNLISRFISVGDRLAWTGFYLLWIPVQLYLCLFNSISSWK